MDDTLFIGKPNKHSLISIGQNWLAISPDGHSVFLKDTKDFHKYFHFDITIIKMVFSPKGQTLYCINKNFQIFQLATTHKKLSENSEFELLIELTPSEFIHVIPYDKVLYIIQDNHIHVIKDHEIVSSNELEFSITAVSPIPKDIAIFHNLIEPSNPLPYVVLVGDETGNVSRVSFPKTLNPLPKFSNPFISHSDPVTLITYQNNSIMFCGKFGTFYSTSEVEGSFPHPIKSIYLSDKASCLLFVSDRRLYVTSLMNPSSFQVVSSFPARIASSIDKYALLESGYLANITSQSPNNLNPRNQFIEYALTKLFDISQETSGLSQQISNAETVLNGLQFIRALKSGNGIINSSIEIHPSTAPDGQITVSVEVKIEPKAGYSCRGTSLLLRTKNETGNLNDQQNEIISLSNVETNSVNWIKEIHFVSPAPITIELLMFYESNDVISIQTTTFNIIDFSLEIPLNQANVGKLSPMHSIHNQKSSSSISYKIIDGSNHLPTSQFFKQPHAFIAPYGEHWTIRFDSNMCFVSAGTESTAIAVRAAILKKACLESDNEQEDTTESLCNEKFSVLQNRGFAISEILQNELLPITDVTQKVMEMQSLTDQWIESII